MNKTAILCLVLGWGFLWAGRCEGQIASVPDANDLDSLLELSLEELMETPIVTSSSRQSHKATLSSTPITIITAQDIHDSGLTTIPEILQFYLGTDVIPITRTRSAVGVRGLHDFVADRTLTLIDGRTADSPLFGGSEFYRYPVLIEDIERIEIVRGPGGAAWGANAFTGVINIITKKPGDTAGAMVSSTLNEFGDTYSHLRVNGASERLRWKLSCGYQDAENSDDAGAGAMSISKPAFSSLIGYDQYEAQDFLRNTIVNTDIEADFSEQTQLSCGAAYAHTEAGDWEFLGYYPGDDAWFETLRLYSKVDRKIDETQSMYLQWNANYGNAKQPSLVKWFSAENELELQYNTRIKQHHLSLGVNGRLIHVNAEQQTDEQFDLQDNPSDDTMVGVFCIDRYHLNRDWILEGQIRSDWYSATQQDFAARASALYSLDESQKNVLRFSVAKSFRTPYVHLRANSITHVNGYLKLLQPDDLENEETWSLETGYTCSLSDHASLRTDVYFQRFDHLIAYRSNDSIPVEYIAENIDGADSWGLETELNYLLSRPNGPCGIAITISRRMSTANCSGPTFPPNTRRGSGPDSNYRINGPVMPTIAITTPRPSEGTPPSFPWAPPIAWI